MRAVCPYIAPCGLTYKKYKGRPGISNDQNTDVVKGESVALQEAVQSADLIDEARRELILDDQHGISSIDCRL